MQQASLPRRCGGTKADCLAAGSSARQTLSMPSTSSDIPTICTESLSHSLRQCSRCAARCVRECVDQLAMLFAAGDTLSHLWQSEQCVMGCLSGGRVAVQPRPVAVIITAGHQGRQSYHLQPLPVCGSLVVDYLWGAAVVIHLPALLSSMVCLARQTVIRLDIIRCKLPCCMIASRLPCRDGPDFGVCGTAVSCG